MKNKLLAILAAGLLSAANANAATWDYTGTVDSCDSLCSSLGIFIGDSVTGFITLDTVSPQTGYVYGSSPTDNFSFDIAGLFIADPSFYAFLGGTADTDASGKFTAGFLEGVFSSVSTIPSFNSTLDLAGGEFAINFPGSFSPLATSQGSFTPQVVPLPAAAWLFISALGGLVVAKRKQLKT